MASGVSGSAGRPSARTRLSVETTCSGPHMCSTAFCDKTDSNAVCVNVEGPDARLWVVARPLVQEARRRAPAAIALQVLAKRLLHRRPQAARLLQHVVESGAVFAVLAQRHLSRLPRDVRLLLMISDNADPSAACHLSRHQRRRPVCAHVAR